MNLHPQPPVSPRCPVDRLLPLCEGVSIQAYSCTAIVQSQRALHQRTERQVAPLVQVGFLVETTAGGVVVGKAVSVRQHIERPVQQPLDDVWITSFARDVQWRVAIRVSQVNVSGRH